MSRVIGPLSSIALLVAAVSCSSEPTSVGAPVGVSAPVQAFVEPNQLTLPAGAQLQLRVRLGGADDTPLGQISFSSTGETVITAWMSSDDNIVTVSSSGFIEARRLGTATISATVTAPCGTHLAVAVVNVVSAEAPMPSPKT